MRTLRELEAELQALATTEGPDSQFWDLLWKLQRAIAEVESD